MKISWLYKCIAVVTALSSNHERKWWKTEKNEIELKSIEVAMLLIQESEVSELNVTGDKYVGMRVYLEQNITEILSM